MKKAANPFHILPRLNRDARFVVERHSTGDWFQDFFAASEDALAYAEYKWGLLTAHEKRNTVAYYVANIEVSGDEDDLDYEVCDIIKEYC